MTEEWKQHLISAEYALENLTKDQVNTAAKMLALEVGSYIKAHGFDEIEKLEQFVSVDALDDEAKEIFVLGMQALLEVVRKVEMSGAEKH